MPFYEHVFIARQDLSQAQVDALAETVTNVIGEFKGQVHKTETWGLKQLAYKIQKNRKGHYVMLSAEVSGEAIASRMSIAVTMSSASFDPGSRRRCSTELS